MVRSVHSLKMSFSYIYPTTSFRNRESIVVSLLRQAEAKLCSISCSQSLALRSSLMFGSTPVLLPGEFHGQRTWASYSPRVCKELDMTVPLTFFLSFLQVFEDGKERQKEPEKWEGRTILMLWVVGLVVVALIFRLLKYVNWRREWQSTPVFLPGESQGRGNLAGYSPWGCKESDTIE